MTAQKTPVGEQANGGKKKEICYLLNIAKRAFRQAVEVTRTAPPQFWPPVLAMIEGAV